jgi:hypothetical protein
MTNIYLRGAAFHITVQEDDDTVEARLEEAFNAGRRFVYFQDFRDVTVRVRERDVSAFWPTIDEEAPQIEQEPRQIEAPVEPTEEQPVSA